MLQPAPSFDGRGEANIETGTVEVTSGPIQSLCAGWTESFPEEPSAAAHREKAKEAAEDVLKEAKIIGYTLAAGHFNPNTTPKDKYSEP